MKRKKPRILNLHDIQKIRKRNLYFAVEYRNGGATYCDTLHHSEIYADTNTANSVIKITPLNDTIPFAPLYGLEAVKFIKKLTNWNNSKPLPK